MLTVDQGISEVLGNRPKSLPEFLKPDRPKLLSSRDASLRMFYKNYRQISPTCMIRRTPTRAANGSSSEGATPWSFRMLQQLLPGIHRISGSGHALCHQWVDLVEHETSSRNKDGQQPRCGSKSVAILQGSAEISGNSFSGPVHKAKSPRTTVGLSSMDKGRKTTSDEIS